MENQITTYNEGGLVADLTTSRKSYCSFVPETDEDRAILFKAMNSPDMRLRDLINEVIYLKDFYCEEVDCVNRETGDQTTAVRTVLLGADGTSYQCVSTGIFSAIKKLMQVYGEPINWTKPIPIRIKQISREKNQILTFIVEA